MSAAVKLVPPQGPRGLFTGQDIVRDTAIDCDVVIVGSGAGGATMAAELAEAGLDVVVLEEGPYATTESFSANVSSSVKRLYRDGGASMALGAPPVLFQEGRAIGGSTVINGGMSWRTPPRILERWHRESAVEAMGPAAMEPFFARVERRIAVGPQPLEAIGRDNELLKQGADKKGWKVLLNRRNQVHCVGSNNCAFGCPTGAKQSSLVTYVPRALHYGARFYADAAVSRIVFDRKRAVGVNAQVTGADGQIFRLNVRAKLTIAACGAIQTPALLHRSGFRAPSGALGRNLSLHPNSKLVALFDDPVRGWEGVHQAYQVREFQEEGFLFAAVNIPPSVLAMSISHRRAGLGQLMAQYQNMVVAGMLLEDSTAGRVRTIGGRPVAFYNFSDSDAERMRRGVALLSELLFTAGARRVILPFEGAPELQSLDDVRRLFDAPIAKERMELLTVHMMGTAAMGADPTRAVTDSFGLVHDADRLAVADASLFPSPIGVNPMETIMALATRQAAHILENQSRFI